MNKYLSFRKQIILFVSIITAGVGFIAFLPNVGAEVLLKTSFDPSYGFILRDWGSIVGLAGIFGVVSAFHPSFQLPILSFLAIEKLIIVFLGLISLDTPFNSGLLPAIINDGLSVLLLLPLIREDLKNYRK